MSRQLQQSQPLQLLILCGCQSRQNDIFVDEAVLALTSKLDHVRLPAKLLEDITVEALLAGGTASFATCLFFIVHLHLQIAYTALKEWPMILKCTVAPETGILENCLMFLLRMLGDEFFNRAHLAIILLT